MALTSVLVAVGVLAGAVVATFAVMSATSRRPGNLGVQGGRLAACPTSPNCVCSQEEDPGHHTEPIRYSGDDPVGRLVAVIGAMPRAKVITSDERYLHAEFTSALFRFVDDVEFQVDPASKVIHCRSASRVGHSDFGVNRRRVEAIRKAFAERDATPAG